jgi:uncharacterized protein (DUF1800 family)
MRAARRRVLVAGATWGTGALSACAAVGQGEPASSGDVQHAARPSVRRPTAAPAPVQAVRRDGPMDEARALHVLQRLTWGPKPGELKALSGRSLEDWAQAQLHPQSLPESALWTERLAGYASLERRHAPVLAEYAALQSDALSARREPPEREQATAQLRALVQKVQGEARFARILRAVHSERQLQEVLVAFWFNHFNVFAGKETVRVTAGYFESEAIRPHVLGRFRDLLGASARHPAMLNYLDNWQSVAPGFRFPQSVQTASSQVGFALPRGLNENYARELLELHTLGVRGGYSQADVTALARVFTGWSFDRRNPGPHDAFRFYAVRHDSSAKEFMGQRVPGHGQQQGEWVLDLLARHPSTARHISHKLARHFVSDEPPAALVDDLSRVFVQTDGDLRAVMRALIRSDAFLDPACHGTRYKAPDRFVISAVRACGLLKPDPAPLAGAIARMGMPVLLCPTPDGWADAQSAWLTPEGLRQRAETANALGAARERSSLRIDLSAMDLPGLSQATRAVLSTLPPSQRVALALASPDFSRY